MLSEITESENPQKPDAADQEPTIVEASATSHLRSVVVPDTEAPGQPESVELADVKLPKTLKATHEALQEANKEKDIRIRRHRVSILTNHLHSLSQGAPVPRVNGDAAAKLASAQNSAAEDMQIEMLGRQFPVIKKRFSELNKVVKDLTDKLNALNSK